MSEQSPPALDEVVREFTRAREQLGKVASTLKEFESISQERQSERASLEVSAAAVNETSSRLYGLTETLERAVSSVADVLGAAESALQATDAGQLMERLTALDRSVAETVAGLDRSYSKLADSSTDLREQVGKQGEKLDSMESTLEAQVEQANSVKSTLTAHASQQEERLASLEQRLQSRFEAIEAAVRDSAGITQSLQQKLDSIAETLAESSRLQDENTHLRTQLDSVRANLKPRQLSALGLDS